MVLVNMLLFIFPPVLMQSLMVTLLGAVSTVSVPTFLCLTDFVMVQEAVLSVYTVMLVSLVKGCWNGKSKSCWCSVQESNLTDQLKEDNLKYKAFINLIVNDAEIICIPTW